MRYTYVGCDSHKNSHTFVFLNFLSEKLGELDTTNTPSDFEPFLKKAMKFLQPDTKFIFGFEDTNQYGRLIVKFLMDKGYTVKHVNANLVTSERNSYNVIQKTDYIDAECAGRVLISRFDDLPLACVDEKYYIMSLLVVKRQSFSKQATRLKRTLHNLLYLQYPNYQRFFCNLDGKSAMDFYETYPSPHTLANVSVDDLNDFFISNNPKGHSKRKAQLILDSVENAGVTPSDFQDSIDHVIRFTVRELKMIVKYLDEIESRMARMLDYFNYPLTSMKGIDTLTACRLITEIGDIRRFKNSKALAQYAGIAPVPHSSGNSDMRLSNKRGNRQLNSLFFNIALVLIAPKKGMVINPFFYDFYHQKISEGKTKKQALKVIQRRIVNIVYGMMKHGEDYINPPVTYINDQTGEILENELNDNQLTHIEKRISMFE